MTKIEMAKTRIELETDLRWWEQRFPEGVRFFRITGSDSLLTDVVDLETKESTVGVHLIAEIPEGGCFTSGFIPLGKHVSFGKVFLLAGVMIRVAQGELSFGQATVLRNEILNSESERL